MATTDNKFPVNTTWGDRDAGSDLEGQAIDSAEDYSQDTAGFTHDIGPETKTEMAMNLEPNKFPRQTGHDSLSSEEALLA